MKNVQQILANRIQRHIQKVRHHDQVGLFKKAPCGTRASVFTVFSQPEEKGFRLETKNRRRAPEHGDKEAGWARFLSAGPELNGL